jgi:CheY-like chemotaxis protein
LKRNSSILLVEDDANDQYFISRAFKDVGVPAHLDTVDNGQSAIDFLSNARKTTTRVENITPWLVLLDLNLPLRSGLEVLKWIRQESLWKTLVVIVLTSSPSEDDMYQAYSAGANAYVLKPADPSQLREFGELLKNFWLKWNQSPPLRV